MSGELDTGRPLPTVRVAARRFAGMDWVGEHWGAEAVVSAGIGSRDHARAAIQLLSCDSARPRAAPPTPTSGFRDLAGPGAGRARHAYLHGAGAIGAGGALPPGSVDVRLAGNLAPTGPARAAPGRRPRGGPGARGAPRPGPVRRATGPRPCAGPAAGAAYRAPLCSTKPLDTTPWYAGDTGNFKNE